MKKLVLLSAVLVLLCMAIAVQASTNTYSGSLSMNTGGVSSVPGSNWSYGDPRLSWEVSWTGTYWTYTYNFSVDKPGGVSHFIIETSPSFTAENIWGFSGFSTALLDTWTRDAQGKSNPFMPLSGVYGIKFEDFDMTSQYISIGFNSDRAPVWGDFYVKDGKVGGIENAAWNVGFTNIDADPTDGPANGSISYHILRPDSTTQPIPSVPEPGTIIAALSLLAPAGFIFGRRK